MPETENSVRFDVRDEVVTAAGLYGRVVSSLNDNIVLVQFRAVAIEALAEGEGTLSAEVEQRRFHTTDRHIELYIDAKNLIHYKKQN